MNLITLGVVLFGRFPGTSNDQRSYAVMSVSLTPRATAEDPIQLFAPTALLSRISERGRASEDWIVLSLTALKAAYLQQAIQVRSMYGNPNLKPDAIAPTGFHRRRFMVRKVFVEENMRAIVAALEGPNPVKQFNAIVSAAGKNSTEWRRTIAEFFIYGQHERALWPRLDCCGPSSETGFRFKTSTQQTSDRTGNGSDDDGSANASMSKDLQIIALETVELYMGPHLTWEDVCAFFHRRSGITDRYGVVIDRSRYVTVTAFRKFIVRTVHPLWLKARREGSYALEMYLAGRDRRGPIHLHCLGQVGQIDGFAAKRKIRLRDGESIELTFAIIICTLSSYIVSFGVTAGAETETVFAQALANCLRDPTDVCMDYGYALQPGEWLQVGIPKEIQGDGKLRVTDVIADAFTSVMFMSVTPPGKPHFNGSAEGSHSRGRRKGRNGKQHVGAAPDQHPIELHEAIHEEIDAILKHNHNSDISKRMPPDFIGRAKVNSPHAFVKLLIEENRVLSVTQPLATVLDVSYSKQEAKLTKNGLTVKKLSYDIDDRQAREALELAYLDGLRSIDVYSPPLAVRNVLFPLPDGRTVTARLNEESNTEAWAGYTFDSVEKKREAQREAAREQEVHGAPHRFRQAQRRERAQGGRQGSKSASGAARKRRQNSSDLNDGLTGEA
jgi:hypothetical protein